MTAAAIALLLVILAGGEPRAREPDHARQAHSAGAILSLRTIEAQILPRLREHLYLGPEFHPERFVYRLKFMRSGRVIWLDVDACTGAVLRHSRS